MQMISCARGGESSESKTYSYYLGEDECIEHYLQATTRGWAKE